MGIGNDSFELKKMFEDMEEAVLAAPTTEPATKPTTTPTPTPARPKPRNPALPEPGVHPKPKAEEENPDVQLFLKKRGLEEKEIKEQRLNEGQFSWLLRGGTPIYSTPGHHETIYMLDDKGNKWEEDAYEGYGVFGGKDYFDLVAEMNGVLGFDKTGPAADNRLFQGADNVELNRRGASNREAGIDMYYDNNNNRNPDTKVPRFTTDPNATYEDLSDPEDDPNQGWFSDPERWDEDEDEGEDTENE